MVPQIGETYSENIQEYREPDTTYKVNETNISGKVSEVDSLEQSIFHILNTERYSNPIYDDDYGIELEQYIGKGIGVIIADIETTLNEALTQDDRVKSVVVDSVEELSLDSCLVKFTVNTIYGDLKENINVVQ